MHSIHGSFTVYSFVLVLRLHVMFARSEIARCRPSWTPTSTHFTIGGIPMEMLYDNMKHVVISRKR